MAPPFPEPTYAKPGEGEGWWWDSLLGAWISPGGFIAYPEGEAGVAREQFLPQLPGDPFFGDITPPPEPTDKLKVVGTVAVVGLLLLALFGGGKGGARRQVFAGSLRDYKAQQRRG